MMPEIDLEDDFKELLSAAAKSETSLVHDFRIQFFSESDSIFAFFEGEDDRLYFMPPIRDRLKSTVHCFDCGGKRKVESIRKDVLEISDGSARCLFFVDRDHDDYLGRQLEIDEHTYISDFYSIESDFISAEAAEIVISDIAGISKTRPEFASIKEAFDRSSERFVRAMKPVMLWSICARSQGGKVNFNNVDVSKMFSRDKAGIIIKDDHFLDYFMKQSGCDKLIVQRGTYRSFRKNVLSDDCKFWIRGKFYLCFFASELHIQLKVASKAIVDQSKKIKIPQSLAVNMIFEALSGRIPKPKSLIHFLDARGAALAGSGHAMDPSAAINGI
ncbi:hypothetical protein ABIE41_003468 [Bosea sp. OAE506]|uniref:DUF4435 domain-containing protein n=1 Tax=Bosea sp. OAE506 TaxID=2663870 RepID=UPI001789A4C6